MPYRFLEDVAIADVAFEAEGRTLRELFQQAALALANTMVSDVETIGQKTDRSFEIEAAQPDMLLFHFLQELIFYKDAEQLLFNRFELDIEQGIGKWRLRANATGEKIYPDKHELLADVKAVSLHDFNVTKTEGGWTASVILDV